MIVTLKIPWRRVLRDLKLPMVIITVYMSGISIYDHFFILVDLHVPIALITVPGTVIALLLGFRTNSAYDRWWEARIIWGGIVNDSRTWVRQLLTFINYEGTSSKEFQEIKKMSFRQMGWNYALTRHLRKQVATQDLEEFISPEELNGLKIKANVPNAILYDQSEEVKKLFFNGQINSYQQVQLDDTLSRFTDGMGKCERIKNTVFPSSYTLLVDLLIYLWIFFLPFGLVDIIGYVLIPTTISLAFSFLVIERIAVYMQDPFESLPSDTPMLSLSKTIEINIKQELGEEQIPKPMEPVQGILM